MRTDLTHTHTHRRLIIEPRPLSSGSTCGVSWRRLIGENVYQSSVTRPHIIGLLRLATPPDLISLLSVCLSVCDEGGTRTMGGASGWTEG